MKIQICTFLGLILTLNSPFAAANNQDKFLGPRDMRGIKSAIDGYIKHKDNIFRYGNWYGPGWWGGSDSSAKPGNKPPVDSLDAIAQRHDFGYQIAEQQGKIYGVSEERRLKGIADYLAVRDAKALPENPKDWPQPPADLTKASRYRDRMITGFTYESPAYQGVAVAGKGLDWATSPIENWELDKSNQLNASDLEKQVTTLQKNWDAKNAAPASSTSSEQPTATDKNTKEPEKPAAENATPATSATTTTPEATTDKNSKETEKADSAPVTPATGNTQPTTTPEAATDKSNKETEKTEKDVSIPAQTSTGSTQQTTTDKTATDEKDAKAEQAARAEIESDPDYIELMRLSQEALSLGNRAAAMASSGKMPTSIINRLRAIQPRVTELGNRLKRKYPNKYKAMADNANAEPNKDKNEPKNTDQQRGGTVFNKDGSKDVLHYEKSNDGKEVAVWTTYDSSGKVIKTRREK